MEVDAQQRDATSTQSFPTSTRRLSGDDYPLTYDADGNPKLPACLDRRKPKLLAAVE